MHEPSQIRAKLLHSHVCCQMDANGTACPAFRVPYTDGRRVSLWYAVQVVHFWQNPHTIIITTLVTYSGGWVGKVLDHAARIPWFSSLSEQVMGSVGLTDADLLGQPLRRRSPLKYLLLRILCVWLHSCLLAFHEPSGDRCEACCCTSSPPQRPRKDGYAMVYETATCWLDFYIKGCVEGCRNQGPATHADVASGLP